MKPKIGIPRALLYYHYYPFWKTLLTALGAEVILSPVTNKTVLDRGIAHAVDEACLPVKLFFGHVLELADQVDYLFMPRLVSVEPKAFICPKLMGLPDMLRNSVEGLPPFIQFDVDFSRGDATREVLRALGRQIPGAKHQLGRAWSEALREQQRYKAVMREGIVPLEALALMKMVEEERPLRPQGRLKAALLGHPYNLYDSYANLDLINNLRGLGVEVLTSEMLSQEVLERGAAVLPKRLFWTLGRNVLGAAMFYAGDPQVKGIIHVASFGCGPDSMVSDLVERLVRRNGEKPFLSLDLDEHSGEAGLLTRLEAFVDLLQRREEQCK